jgi:hypothetical protein
VIRSVVLYIILVGIPVLGVSTILRIGRDLRPPVSFSGSWRVEAWPDSACLITSDPDTLQLVVEQSGPLLEIRFSRGTRMVGRVEGDSFTAAGRNRVRMTVKRVPDLGPNHFAGLVSGAPCIAAKRTRLRGTRDQLPAALSGH